MKMKASIIVPTFRRMSLLRRALASLANLDFPTDQFEVIVVNDGDPRTSARSVRASWRSSAPLIYTRIAHRGLSAAVNHGLRRVRGEYFTILADDDALLPNKLKVCCGFLDAHPRAHVVYTLPRYIDGADAPIETPRKIRDFLRTHPRLSWRHVRRGDPLLVHGTGTVYRRTVLDKGGLWDERRKTAEEYYWHLGLLRAGFVFHALDIVTTLYRVHDGNKSKKYMHRRGHRSRRRGPVRRLRAKHVDVDARFTGGATKIR